MPFCRLCVHAWSVPGSCAQCHPYEEHPANNTLSLLWPQWEQGPSACGPSLALVPSHPGPSEGVKTTGQAEAATCPRLLCWVLVALSFPHSVVPFLAPSPVPPLPYGDQGTRNVAVDAVPWGHRFLFQWVRVEANSS